MNASNFLLVRPGARGFVALLLVVLLPLVAGPGHAAATGDPARPSAPPADSMFAGRLISAEDLARALADTTRPRPEVLQVGFKVLFRTGHIPGSRYIGPGSKPEGIDALTRALGKIPKTRDVVLYCGCCPWADCPNVRPALRAAQRAGFPKTRVLYVARNLQHDWVDKGLPIREGD